MGYVPDMQLRLGTPGCIKSTFFLRVVFHPEAASSASSVLESSGLVLDDSCRLRDDPCSQK